MYREKKKKYILPFDKGILLFNLKSVLLSFWVLRWIKIELKSF